MPMENQTFAMFQLHCLLIGFGSIIANLKSVSLDCQQTVSIYTIHRTHALIQI